MANQWQALRPNLRAAQLSRSSKPYFSPAGHGAARLIEQKPGLHSDDWLSRDVEALSPEGY